MAKPSTNSKEQEGQLSHHSPSNLAPRTFIFDLDGTLLDTLNDLQASTNYALRQIGAPERTYDEVRQFVGNGVRKLIERAIPDGESNPRFEECFAIFQRHYLEHGLDTTAPYPGVTAMLAELHRRGHPMAIVSNKFMPATVELCERFFPGLVDVVIGEHEGVRRKPAPDMVDEALQALGVGKENAVYVGDSDVDLATARNSSLPCISVLWGFRDREFLIRHGATTFISSPAELLQ